MSLAPHQKEALVELFKAIDTNSNGYIELDELKTLASGSSAEDKLEEARETMSWLDQDGNRDVSVQEFVEVFGFMTGAMDDEEFDLFIADARVRAGAKASRQVLLRKVFRELDADHSGFIEMHELKTLVGNVAPAESVKRASGTLSMFDNDGDSRVSLEEFISVFDFLAQDMDEHEFGALLAGLTSRGFETLYAPDYKHPHGVRTYLEAEVVPTLRRAMLELVKVLEGDKLDLATGVPWDDGAHMPRGWRPFSPLRWLADWLMEAARPRFGLASEYDAEGGDGPPFGAEDADGPRMHKSFEDMSREEKLGLVFRQIDVHNSGYVRASTLLDIAKRMLGPSNELQGIEHLLSNHKLEPGSKVEPRTFVRALMGLTIHANDEEFEEMIRPVVALRDWRYCHTRDEKFRYLFHFIDLDKSGSLSLSELKVLALRMDPEASEETIAATLEFLDKDASESVSEEEFVDAVMALLSHLEGEAELDDAIQRMMHLGGMAGMEDAAAEVEPEPLAALVRAFKTHVLAAQLPASSVMDKLASRQPMVLVDVRPEEERSISGMPGAVAINLAVASSAQWGYSLAMGPAAAATAVREALAAATAGATHPSSQPPAVVAYCATGERGNVGALLLSDALHMTVYNLCGGLINYYNQGGNVFAAGGTGRQVQAIHPGAPALRGMVTRPNNFRFE